MSLVNAVHGAAMYDSVQQKTVQGKENSVQESHTTELAHNSEPVD